MSNSLAITASTSSSHYVPSVSSPSQSLVVSSTTSTSSSLASSKSSYHTEIQSMVYVFTGRKQQQQNSGNVELVTFIQDVVRKELVALVIAAKLQASRRTLDTSSHPISSLPSSSSLSKSSSSTSSTSTPLSQTSQAQIQLEDLLFPLRHDPSKIERLRLYLSWRDVRKKTRHEPGGGNFAGSGGGGGGGDEDEIDGIEEPDKNLKVGKSRINLSWELSDPWTDYLLDKNNYSTSSSTRSEPPEEEEEELLLGQEGGVGEVNRGLSVEEKKAFELNREILREANEMTEKMSREEYEQYSTARQASFVYRKSKKFRDFLLVDSTTLLSDELLDILGFLGYELVRSLCKAATRQTRSRLEYEEDRLKLEEKEEEEGRKGKKRKSSSDRGGKEEEEEEGEGKLDPKDKDYPSVLRPVPMQQERKKKKGQVEPIVSLFSAPIESTTKGREKGSGGEKKEGDESHGRVEKGYNEDEDSKKKTKKKEVVIKSMELKDLVEGFWNETNNPTGTGTGTGRSGKNGKVAMGKGLRSWRGGVGAVRGRGGSLV